MTPAPAAAGSQRNGRRSAISRSSASRKSARGSPSDRRSRPASPKLVPAIAAEPPCCPIGKALLQQHATPISELPLARLCYTKRRARGESPAALLLVLPDVLSRRDAFCPFADRLPAYRRGAHGLVQLALCEEDRRQDAPAHR